MIRERVDLKKVDCRLAVSDNPVGRLPVKIRCREPSHRARDHEESLAVYAEGLCCYGCGFEVQRRMEALSYLLFGSVARWREAIKVADKYTFQSLDAYREKAAQKARRDPLPKSLALVYSDYLWQTHKRMDSRHWLYARGLKYEPLRYSFQVGHTGTTYTIPVFDQAGNLISIRYRRDDLYECTREEGERGSPKYYGMSGRNGEYMYPEWLIEKERPNTLAVFEGEFDTMLSWQGGEPGVTITNGAGNLHKLPALIRERFPFVEKLAIVGDMDEPGRVAAALTGYNAAAEGFKVERVEWPLEYGKDLTDYYMNIKKKSL